MGKLDAAAWPASASVDSLRDELEALKKKGVKDPFVYIELGMWLVVFLHCLLLLSFRETDVTAMGLAAASSEQRWGRRCVSLLEHLFLLFSRVLRGPACLLWHVGFLFSSLLGGCRSCWNAPDDGGVSTP